MSSEKLNIIVTGGGGFLGTHLCKALLKKGHVVTSLSRSFHKHLDKLGVKQCQVDLKNLNSIVSALKNQDIVFHVGSKVGIWGKRKDFFETNVNGTKNVIEACLINGIKKLVFTSSPSVVFGNKDILGSNEKLQYPDKYYSEYAHSKSLAEDLVLKANSNMLATIALRPHLIFGPGDHHIIPRIIDSAKKKKLKIVGNGDNLVDVIYVENAVKAHLEAMEKLEIGNSLSGQTYFLGQEKPVNLWDFINEILVSSGVEPVTKKISYEKAYKIGAVLERVFGWLGRKEQPPMTRFLAMQLAKNHYFDHSKAKKDLNYTDIIPTNIGIEKTIESLKEKNHAHP